ncbi:MAG: hypothetical protein RIQ52_1667, partial [Pseudomonadota bacterium]
MPPAVYIRHGCIAGLLLLAGLFLSPFWHAILWAAIFTTMSWPVYDRLRQRWITHPNVTAFLMTLAIVAAITLPPLWMMTEIQQELPTLEELSTTPGSWRFSPEWLQGLPWPGNQAGYWLDSILADPWSHQGIRDYLSKTLLSGTTGLMKQLPHHIASAVLFVICLFFL